MDWLAAYLDEDLPEGDITSEAIFSESDQGRANLVMRQAGFVAGLDAAAEVFSRLGVTAQHDGDGRWVDAGEVVMRLSGPTRGLLAGERLALNMVGRMSGIATQTRKLVEVLGEACSGAVVAGTRKTTPGFRHFEKEAIRIAGGATHRYHLGDEAMIKDNHREAAGSVAAAVAAVKNAHPNKVLTTEVESLDDALAAAEAGTDWILIDNQTPTVGRQWAEAVWARFPGVKVEASGGIQGDNIADYGWADRISLGALTHQAQSIDVSLEWQ